jgi:acyl-homoserine lactone acylase PvdQ
MLWRSMVLDLLIAVPASLRAQKAEILWDSWDVPHIYASNDASWGDIYRVDLAGQDLPANGGPDSLGVHRVLDHFIDDTRGHLVARYGDAYSMIVEFFPSPHAVALLVAGNSEHTTDGAVEQAKLFPNGMLRSVWRERSEIEMHTRLRETLHHEGAQ